MKKIIFALLAVFVSSTVLAGTLDDALERGRKYSDQKDFGKAIKEYGLIISASPNSPQAAIAYYNRGIAYYMLDNCGNTVSDLSKALDMNDYSMSKVSPEIARSSALYIRGSCYVKRGEKGKALQDFDASIEAYPYNEKAYIERAGLRLNIEGFKAALKDFQDAKELEWLSYFRDSLIAAGKNDSFAASYFLSAALVVTDELDKKEMDNGLVEAMRKLTLAMGYLETIRSIRSEPVFTKEDKERIEELFMKAYVNVAESDEQCSHDLFIQEVCDTVMQEYGRAKEEKRPFWKRAFGCGLLLAGNASGSDYETTRKNFRARFGEGLSLEQLKKKLAEAGKQKYDFLTGEKTAPSSSITYERSGKFLGLTKGSVWASVDGEKRKIEDLSPAEKKELWDNSNAEQRAQLRDLYGYTTGLKNDWGRDMMQTMDAYYEANNMYSKMGELAGYRAATKFMPQDSVDFINGAKRYLEVHGGELSAADREKIEAQIKDVQKSGYLIGATTLLMKNTQIQGGTQLTISVVKDYLLGLTRSGFAAGSELAAEVANELLAIEQSAEAEGMSLNERIDLLGNRIRQLTSNLGISIRNYKKQIDGIASGNSSSVQQPPPAQKKGTGACSHIQDREARKKCAVHDAMKGVQQILKR